MELYKINFLNIIRKIKIEFDKIYYENYVNKIISNPIKNNIKFYKI